MNYEIRVPEDLKAFRVPKLILQPLVENSIIHGIEPYKRGGLVTIQAYDTGKVLFIVVEDNGHGMDGESLEKLKKNLREPDENYTSIGVQNVDRRIRMHYGEAYKLEIDSRLGKVHA